MIFSEDFWVSAQKCHDLFKAPHWLEHSVFEHCCELVLDTRQKDCDVQWVQFQLLSQIMLEFELVQPVEELSLVNDFQDAGFDLNSCKITSLFSR